MGSGISGLMLSMPLKIQYKPVTRLENMCATGSEAMRNACYAVASGAYDLVMAIGVEKLKDSGYSGLIGNAPPNDGTDTGHDGAREVLAARSRLRQEVRRREDELKEVLSRIAWKNHENGAQQPEGAVPQGSADGEDQGSRRKVAGMLGIFDCSGVSDGSAAAIVCRAEDAHKYTRPSDLHQGALVRRRPGRGLDCSQDYDFTTFPEVVASAKDAYKQAGVTDPRDRDQHGRGARLLHADRAGADGGPRASRRAAPAWKDVLDGRFDLDGAQPVNPDGGLKSFGHPIGASGLRMMYEMWLQLRGEAGPRQIKNPKLGLTHNLGGAPGRCVSFVSVVGQAA